MCLSGGNENERAYLLPLLDALAARGIHPHALFADRGYDSRALTAALRERGIEPHIPRRRTPGEAIPEGVPVVEVRRGSKRTLKTRDPQARERWVVERTIAWLRNRRRIATRRDRKPETYEAFLQLAMILVLVRAF